MIATEQKPSYGAAILAMVGCGIYMENVLALFFAYTPTFIIEPKKTRNASTSTENRTVG